MEKMRVSSQMGSKDDGKIRLNVVSVIKGLFTFRSR